MLRVVRRRLYIPERALQFAGRSGQKREGWTVPSDTKVCPFCGERIQAAAERCRHCHSDLPAVTGQPSAEPGADEEVLLRDARDLRKPLRTAVGVLVAILVAYGAIRGVSILRPQHHPQQHSAGFNIFVQIRNACDEDDGSLVTTDTHGTPMAFPTPDGPERYWCVSWRYLTSIGHGPQDPLPPVSEVPSAFKWRWPSTTYGK